MGEIGPSHEPPPLKNLQAARAVIKTQQLQTDALRRDAQAFRAESQARPEQPAGGVPLIPTLNIREAPSQEAKMAEKAALLAKRIPPETTNEPKQVSTLSDWLKKIGGENLGKTAQSKDVIPQIRAILNSTPEAKNVQVVTNVSEKPAIDPEPQKNDLDTWKDKLKGYTGEMKSTQDMSAPSITAIPTDTPEAKFIDAQEAAKPADTPPIEKPTVTIDNSGASVPKAESDNQPQDAAVAVATAVRTDSDITAIGGMRTDETIDDKDTKPHDPVVDKSLQTDKPAIEPTFIPVAPAATQSTEASAVSLKTENKVTIRQDLIDDPTKDPRSELHHLATQAATLTQPELALIKVGSANTGGFTSRRTGAWAAEYSRLQTRTEANPAPAPAAEPEPVPPVDIEAEKKKVQDAAIGKMEQTLDATHAWGEEVDKKIREQKEKEAQEAKEQAEREKAAAERRETHPEGQLYQEALDSANKDVTTLAREAQQGAATHEDLNTPAQTLGKSEIAPKPIAANDPTTSVVQPPSTPIPDNIPEAPPNEVVQPEQNAAQTKKSGRFGKLLRRLPIIGGLFAVGSVAGVAATHIETPHPHELSAVHATPIVQEGALQTQATEQHGFTIGQPKAPETPAPHDPTADPANWQ